MKRLNKIVGFIPALALSAALTFGAGAQGIVDDVIDGAENVVDDTVDTVEDIADGADDAVTGDDTVVGDDIPDQVGDDAGTTIGESSTSGEGAPNAQAENPSTGIGVPFMTAGLVAVGAAGLAYLTRNREGFGKEKE